SRAPAQPAIRLARVPNIKKHAMAETLKSAIAVIGSDKFVPHSWPWIGAAPLCCDRKWSRGQVQARFANMSPCLIAMEADVGAHHLSGSILAEPEACAFTGHAVSYRGLVSRRTVEP